MILQAGEARRLDRALGKHRICRQIEADVAVEFAVGRIARITDSALQTWRLESGSRAKTAGPAGCETRRKDRATRTRLRRSKRVRIDDEPA